MPNYIDRDVAIKVLQKSNNSHAETSRDVCLLERNVRLLKEQPTIDAVEVVRCKDCKYWSRREGCVPFQHLHNCYRQYGAAMTADDFCSLGEKGECAYD